MGVKWEESALWANWKEWQASELWEDMESAVCMWASVPPWASARTRLETEDQLPNHTPTPRRVLQRPPELLRAAPTPLNRFPVAH